ncbi:MAG: hypothetical protein ACKVXR_18190, partial [Planctomycetota bacterium]
TTKSDRPSAWIISLAEGTSDTTRRAGPESSIRRPDASTSSNAAVLADSSTARGASPEHAETTARSPTTQRDAERRAFMK